MTVQNYFLDWAKKMPKNTVFNGLFRTILIVTMLVIALNPAYAAVLKQAVIIDHLNKDLSVFENINITLADNAETSFALTLPDKARNIIVNGQKYANNSLKMPLNCTECKISISYVLNNIIKKNNAQYSFYRTLNFPKVPVQQIYQLYLPVGYSINISDQTSPSVVPTPSEISTDGESIIIGWKENNPQLPKQYLVVYYDTEQFESLSYIIKNDITHTSVLIFGVLLLIIGFAAGFLAKQYAARKEQKKMPKSGEKQYFIPSSLLSPDEKIVVNFLKKKNAKKNPVNQKEIGKELNWSKSKVSAVLSNLYYKKLTDREKFGRNYKVKLVKDVQ
jgi:uncharacterized membrane protein